MNKYRGGEGRRRVRCMDPGKVQKYLYAALTVTLDTLDTYTCRLLHELYGVVVCRLENMGHTV